MKKKTCIIVIIILLLAGVVFAFCMSDTGSNFFENYGTNFKNNIYAVMKKLNIPVEEEKSDEEKEYEKLVEQYEEEKKKQQEEIDKQTEQDDKAHKELNIASSGINIAFDDAANSCFEKYSDGILAVNETKMTFYSKNAKEKWSCALQMSSPMLRVKDSYILIFEKEGNKLSLYRSSKKLYENTLDGTIKTASVSSAGDVAVVYERGVYKGSIGVYNKSGEEVYLWNSGKYGILNVDISKSRRLCATLLNADEGADSKIYFFNIKKSGVDAEIDIPDSIVFDVGFVGNTLNAYADNAVYGISENAKIKWTYELGEKEFTYYTMCDNGTKVIASENNNSSEFTIVSVSGKEKLSVKTDVLPDFLDISDNRILYNNGRALMIADMNGNVVSKYTCSRDVKTAYIIDSKNVFIAYNSSIEFLKTNK